MFLCLEIKNVKLIEMINTKRKSAEFFLAVLLGAMFFAKPVFAVPSLIPAASVFVVLASKIFMALGCVFFFSFSLVSKNKKIFISLGLVMMAGLIIIVFL